MSMKVKHWFKNEVDFAELLEKVSEVATKEWDINFVADIQQRYHDYEKNCFLTKSQLQHLKRIAGE